jgi:hypothetical protein
MQAPAGRRERRDRHVYILKGDAEIYQLIAKYQFVTAEMASDILGRDPSTVRKRFLALYEAGWLNRARRDEMSPYVYFLDEKGALEAARIGFLPEPRFIKSKSSLLVNHDLEITMFHRALDSALYDADKVLEWKQWRGDLKDEVETPDGIRALIPDAFFVIDHQDAFFLEVVKSYESEYENGVSNIEQKIELYHAYKHQFQKKYQMGDFRVLWVLPTKARVLGLLSKLEDRFPYRRFYATDEESYRRDILGKIWWTPKDFRTMTYALL